MKNRIRKIGLKKIYKKTDMKLRHRISHNFVDMGVQIEGGTDRRGRISRWGRPYTAKNKLGECLLK